MNIEDPVTKFNDMQISKLKCLMEEKEDIKDMRFLSFRPTKKIMYYINKAEAIYSLYNRTELFDLGFSVFLEKYSPSEFTKKEALEFSMSGIDYESLDIKKYTIYNKVFFR